MKRQGFVKKLSALAMLTAVLLLTTIPALAAELPGNEPAADENTEGLQGAALVESFGLTPCFYDKGSSEVVDAYMDEAGRLVVQAGGTAGNLYLKADLGIFAGELEEYTVEVKLMGVAVSNNWHYGMSWNNTVSNNMRNYFTMRSGPYGTGNQGQLMCYPAVGSNTTQFMGKPDTPFAEMSSEINVENVFSATYTKENTTITYQMNGVEVAAIADAENDYTLQDFHVVIPYKQTVAITYLRVYDQNGSIVYNQDFQPDEGGEEKPKHSVTVSYEYTDGTEAAAPQTQSVAEGEYYSFTSPAIEGYVPDSATTFGQMGTEDISLKVIYRKAYKVTVHYLKADGSQMFDDVVIENLVNGDDYLVKTIPVANYTFDTEQVEGVIAGADVEVTVTYSLRKYTLTIRYQYADGSSAGEDYVAEITYGESYSVATPSIAGYTPDKAVVSADSIRKNTEVTVTYTAEAAETEQQTGGTSEAPGSGCGSTLGLTAIVPILLGALLVSRKKKFR